MAQKKLPLTLGIIVCCIAIVVGIKWFKGLNEGEMATAQVSFKGPDNAAVKIVEFIDFQCPACAYGAKLLKETMEKHPGKVSLQLKHFPLPMHWHAMTASLYTECAGRQGAFWPFHDLIIENQAAWSKLTIVRPHFMNYVQQLNLDANAISSCIDEEVVRLRVMQDREEGQRQGVRSTPTYLINGDLVVGPKSLEGKLDELLNVQ